IEMAKQKYDHMFDVILIGDTGVGKSKLLNSYLGERNSCTKPAISWDRRYPCIKLQGKKIALRILDPSPAYDERMDFMYKKMMGAILMYNTNKRESFDNVTKWFQRFIVQNIYNAEKILLGTSFVNHGFLPRREVSKERGQQLASSLGISFREIHSEDDLAGINEAFETIANAILLRYLYPTGELLPEEKEVGDNDDDDDGAANDICSTM
ncbi:hypothetical protein EMCRGX_G003055, partial [Ephydatia muelleri]